MSESRTQAWCNCSVQSSDPLDHEKGCAWVYAAPPSPSVESELVECLRISGEPIDGDSYADAEHRKLMLQAADRILALAAERDAVVKRSDKLHDLLQQSEHEWSAKCEQAEARVKELEAVLRKCDERLNGGGALTTTAQPHVLDYGLPREIRAALAACEPTTKGER